MAEKDDYLLDLLVDLGFANAGQVAKARTEAEAAGVGVVDLLAANKIIRPADVTQARAAQFGAEVVPVPPVDRVQHFVGLFERIGLDGIERLLTIPGAASGSPQALHDGDCAFETFAGCRHC